MFLPSFVLLVQERLNLDVEAAEEVRQRQCDNRIDEQDTVVERVVVDVCESGPVE